ncbi:replication restart helicase PriA [Parasphaerochaeta coccoides]|uniref:Replication restart protein PriA n=1 Tax=Parasphaerochaeta coccoides (strain ATCC BAA-1237 / DSM 17374 / SPN1) TaxID=760011 RepID=F4GI56_PARC1|nr:primosomal protein N' [Parasphaerochaeta coccoides]AEC02654.1 primosomal protein N' [Parasphaerochaeta coccoides DSM 17374]
MMRARVLANIPVDKEFDYAVPPSLEEKVKPGVRVAVPFGNREITAFVIDVFPDDVLKDEIKNERELKDIKRAIDKEPVFSPREVELAKWMAAFYFCSPGEALSVMVPGGRRDVGVPAFAVEDELTDGSVELTGEQEAAIASISSASHAMYYLYGVTGSGKSEVFFRAARHVVDSGRQVIYLVPEITLTHQLSRMVACRFPGRVAVLHSALTASQRIDQWKRILRGEVDMIIGARSAVFAPCPRLGMIIIDEEHENSYKAGSTPRYHARQVAQKRCADAGATLVMGSATPSLEAWKLMHEDSGMLKLELPQRVGGGRPPVMEVVDMLRENRMISRRLEEEMRLVLGRGKQVILFLNRRGYSYFFHCATCGYEMSCPHCSVSLTYHKNEAMMVCHYCGYTRSPVTVCPDCGSLDVGYSGFGTEMVEQEVARMFPSASLARLDTDSTRDRDAMALVLEDFRHGKIDILLGTQMVAKGLNFPGVELVGVVLADSGLNVPDFRSREHTFSLLVQVSGRAGRYNDKGRVVVQTYKPGNEAVTAACAGDVDGFYDRELDARRETGFPPYGRMVNLVVRGRNKDKAETEAARLAEICESTVSALVRRNPGRKDLPEVFGTSSCPVEKIAGNWRFHVLLRGMSPALLHQMIGAVVRQYKAPSGIYMEIDIDPLHLL